MSTDMDQLLKNVHAESWSDLESDDEYTFDNERATPLERFESYVDYCFETYPVVYNNLDRENVQTCIADWGRRRGQCRYNKKMKKRKFGKRVASSQEKRYSSNYVLFLATALVGVPPEHDNGDGWKACVRHELGHAIDYEKRGTSDHGPKFKSVMAQFGENNDGQSQHGYAPRYHR